MCVFILLADTFATKFSFIYFTSTLHSHIETSNHVPFALPYVTHDEIVNIMAEFPSTKILVVVI